MTDSENFEKEKTIAEEREDLRFHFFRNVVYHEARQRFLTNLNRWTTLVVIVLGTATAVDALGVWHVSVETGKTILGGLVTLVGSLQLVFDFAVRAKNHEILKRDYYRVLADIDGVATPTRDNIAQWKRSLVEIAADEPPTMWAMDAVAHNVAARSLYGDQVPVLSLKWYHEFFKNMWAFAAGDFKDGV